MASTSTTICNLALNDVPSARITSLSDGSLNAGHCSSAYPEALKQLMAKAAWSFDTTRVTLAATTNDRTGEWGYAYARPADIAIITGLISPVDPAGAGAVLGGPEGAKIDGATLKPWRYEIAKDVIYTDLSGALLEYISDDPDVTAMPPYFTKALAAMVTAMIIMPITRDRQRKADAEGAAAIAILDAIAANENAKVQSYGDDFIPDSIAARMGW